MSKHEAKCPKERASAKRGCKQRGHKEQHCSEHGPEARRLAQTRRVEREESHPDYIQNWLPLFPYYPNLQS